MQGGGKGRDPAPGRRTGWKRERAKVPSGRRAGRKDRPDLPSLLAGSPLSRLELEPAHEASPVREVGL
jgi:hypothetical protein